MMILRRLKRDDSGLTMVELLVYSLLLAGVMTIIGSLLINTLRTEDTVSGVTDATTAAQLTATSVSTGVRNSSGFLLSTVGSSDQVLVARVTDDDGVWTCRAWYYSNSENSIRTLSSATKILPASWTAASLQGWLLLASGVQPKQGAAATAPIFSFAGSTLKMDFRVLAEDYPPATITSSAAVRLAQGSTQCY